jgi:hypothetical protein
MDRLPDKNTVLIVRIADIGDVIIALSVCQ